MSDARRAGTRPTESPRQGSAVCVARWRLLHGDCRGLTPPPHDALGRGMRGWPRRTRQIRKNQHEVLELAAVHVADERRLAGIRRLGGRALGRRMADALRRRRTARIAGGNGGRGTRARHLAGGARRRWHASKWLTITLPAHPWRRHDLLRRAGEQEIIARARGSEFASRRHAASIAREGGAWHDVAGSQVARRSARVPARAARARRAAHAKPRARGRAPRVRVPPARVPAARPRRAQAPARPLRARPLRARRLRGAAHGRRLHARPFPWADPRARAPWAAAAATAT